MAINRIFKWLKHFRLTPEQFAEFVASETAKFARIIQTAGVKAVD